MGTILWKWCDDDGKAYSFTIPNSYYVPAGKVRLLSPQHWAQTQRDTKPLRGTGSETLHNQVSLFWNQRSARLMIPLNKEDNVATFQMAPGYNKFTAFCSEAEIEDQEEMDPIIANPATISDNEQSDDEVDKVKPTTPWFGRSQTPDNPIRSDTAEPDPLTTEPDPLTTEPDTTEDSTLEGDTPTQIPFELDGPKMVQGQTPVIMEDEEHRQPTNTAAELLQYHHRFGHIGFRSLQYMEFHHDWLNAQCWYAPHASMHRQPNAHGDTTLPRTRQWSEHQPKQGTSSRSAKWSPQHLGSSLR